MLVEPRRALEGEIETVFVGDATTGKSFRIHRELLIKHSRKFRLKLKRRLGQSSLIRTLQDTEPVLFSHLVHWLYVGSVDEERLGSRKSQEHAYTRLYILARGLGIDTLADLCFVKVCEHYSTTQMPRVSTIKRLYDADISAYGLREYLINLLAYEALKSTTRFHSGIDRLLENDAKFAEEFSLAVLEQSRKRRKNPAAYEHPYEVESAKEWYATHK